MGLLMSLSSSTTPAFAPPENEGRRNADGIIIHDAAGMDGMREAGRLAALALDEMVALVRPGITTDELDAHVMAFAEKHDAIPAPLNYRGFPKAICTSLNHVVCHGIPGERVLKEGDILNIDITLIKNGWHGDTSRMFWVGDVSVMAQKLTRATFEAMHKGISAVRAGGHVGDIGAAIETHAKACGMTAVEEFTGHGLGRIFHDEPAIYNHGAVGTGAKLAPYMFFTVEPMLNAGRADVKVLADGWTAVTRDRSLSAQFEHSVGITPEGTCEIFTLSPGGFHCPPYD